MHLYHFEEDPKFGRRFVWEETQRTKTEEVEATVEGGGKHNVKIEGIKNVDAADRALERQETAMLDEIASIREGSKGRIKGLLDNIPLVHTKGNIDTAVHTYHERKAFDSLEGEYSTSAKGIKRIRKGRVDKWGTGEVAVATGKLRELAESKKTVTQAISENQARAKKYNALIAQWSASVVDKKWYRRDKKRISRKEEKSFLGREPGRVDELKEVQKSVTSIEGETKGFLRDYDAKFKEKYREYAQDESKFRGFFFSFPAMQNDEEIRSKFDDWLDQDQFEGDPEASPMFKKIDEANLPQEQKDLLKDLYGKLVQRPDQKMRELIRARNVKEHIANVSPEVLKKLPVGQDVAINYSALSHLNTRPKADNREGKTVTQNAYVTGNTGSVVTLRVSNYELAKFGMITRDYRDGITDKTSQYKPEKAVITIDLATNRITQKIEAMDTGKDAKGERVTLTDTTDIKLKDGAFENINISGDINKKHLT